MDGRDFDDLARALATRRSRRGVLRGALALATGAVGLRQGDGVDAAAKLRRSGLTCRGNGECSSGLCGEPDRTGRGRCLCTGPADCPQPRTPCTIATCSTAGVCGVIANTGATCDTGNPCTTNDACDARGRCAGTPIVCSAPDQCRDAGVCDKGAGTCTNPPKPNGTACNDGNLCTTNDSCQAGVCAGTPVVCPASGQCITPGICNPATGGCEYAFQANGTSCDDGNACTVGDTCLNGWCQPGTELDCPICHPCMNGVCGAGFGAVPVVDIRCSQSGPGRACCGGFCVETFSDNANCGGCGNRCASGATCTNGVCVGANCSGLSCLVVGNPF